jgi:hypothetical protein
MPDFIGTVPMVHWRFPANQKLKKVPAWTSVHYFTLHKNMISCFTKIYDQTSFQEPKMMLPPQKFMLSVSSLLTAEN